MEAGRANARLRSDLSKEQRTGSMRMAIDPGFVHHRKITTLLGRNQGVVDRAIEKLPALPEYVRRVRIDHIYANVLIDFARANGFPSLGQILSAGRGRAFSSIEEVAPTPEIYDLARVETRVEPAGESDIAAQLDYSTDRVVADTLRSRLHDGTTVGVIAELAGRDDDGVLHFEPLLMGSPWLTRVAESPAFDGPEWWSYDYGQVFVDDIDEFAATGNTAAPEDWSEMERLTESAIKTCLAEILGTHAEKDWGGERSDLYSAHVSLNGGRTQAAFLLKGPARFQPMKLTHLGKNNDQIFRLSHEPAQLLVVQHCHEIGPEVRGTLRAFAITPGAVRHYCFIDGRDTYRLLDAYGKLPRARELSA